MISYSRFHRTLAPWRRAMSRGAVIAFGAAALGISSCSPTDILNIEDPDIVNPSDVQSVAGANAVRLGALARLNLATSGAATSGESLTMLGGLFADEWINGDSFIARQEIDQRVITPQNTFLDGANRALHRARLAAEQAVTLLERYNPTAPRWQVAEMHFVQAYIVNLMAEHYCSGLVFSTVADGVETFGSPITTVAAFERALAHANDGLALITGSTADDVRVRNALQVVRARILMNLNRPADAATAATGVATSFVYNMLHSATSRGNVAWGMNNLNWRYSVANNEGGNGLNFATANDPRVPVCVGGDATCRAAGVTRTTRDDQSSPLMVQLLWQTQDASFPLLRGVDARMLEAEAQLRAGNAGGALATINAARATVTGLTPLADAGSDAARVDQLFREKAFWTFSRGYRVGDLRRLIRQHSRPAASVFPVGTWHKGGNYGVDVTIPVPLSEQNNPNVAGSACLDRNP